MSKTIDVSIILVGNELLKGERRDSHLAYIGHLLMERGVGVSRACVVGDDEEQIAGMVSDLIERSRVLLVSGGLGPTHDDITREGVARGLGVTLEFNSSEWTVVEEIFKKFGSVADESNRRQAYFPQGATPMANPTGTAAGFMMVKSECLLAVLPGPPRELVPMFEQSVLPHIDKRFNRPPLLRETFRTTGIGESAMTPLVMPIFEKYDDFIVSSLPGLGGVDIVITQKPGERDPARVREKADAFERELRATLGGKIYAKGSEPLESVVGEALSKEGATLAVAESLTGGLIGRRLTNTPGSSRYLLADVVAYSNDAKMTFLGVREESLIRFGAVSEAVCREMADGVRRRTGATYALATTGIAGPGGGTDEKPLGLSYYGLTWDGGEVIRHRVFPGGREDVRVRVTFATLLLLHDRLQAGQGR